MTFLVKKESLKQKYWKMRKICEQSGNFVSPGKWES